MKFISKLAGVARPRTDVFTYLFDARRPYPSDRVLYREDVSNATLTLDELKRKSRQFATILVEQFNIQVMDPVAVLASDSVRRSRSEHAVDLLTVWRFTIPLCIWVSWQLVRLCSSFHYRKSS
jgi:acyl-CoA synthetase (AMP-forming)/AMP-acid ligase II